MPTAAFVSFRLRLHDGVSVVARSWGQSFQALGWHTYTVAGRGPVTKTVPGLEIGAEAPPDPDALSDALAEATVVVVENLLTIPMNLQASRVAAQVLKGRPAILHHHDPPWQRERFAHITELPPDDPNWRHVTINRYTEAQFAERSLTATTIYNGFDTDVAPGNRSRQRDALGVEDNELLFVHPVRAIQRKNIGRAVEIAALAGATYWLTGSPEDGYGPELERILANASCKVIHQNAINQADMYAASDLVLFPSTWEGFGNPPIEAALRNKPVVIGDYPVARELIEMGFDWLSSDITARNISRIVDSARDPDPRQLATNREIAVANLSLDRMTQSVKSVLIEAGW